MFTTHWPWVCAAALILLLLFLLCRRRAPSDRYYVKEALLNRGEIELLKRLEAAFPSVDYRVLAQVSMSQLFEFKWREEGREITQRKLNAVSKKSVDFLICYRHDMRIAAAIELNGPMHERRQQKKADAVKRHALESAGIPFLVYGVGDLPTVAALQRDLQLK